MTTFLPKKKGIKRDTVYYVCCLSCLEVVLRWFFGVTIFGSSYLYSMMCHQTTFESLGLVETVASSGSAVPYGKWGWHECQECQWYAKTCMKPIETTHACQASEGDHTKQVRRWQVGLPRNGFKHFLEIQVDGIMWCMFCLCFLFPYPCIQWDDDMSSFFPVPCNYTRMLQRNRSSVGIRTPEPENQQCRQMDDVHLLRASRKFHRQERGGETPPKKSQGPNFRKKRKKTTWKLNIPFTTYAHTITYT